MPPVEAEGHFAKHVLHPREHWSDVLRVGLPTHLHCEANERWLRYRASRALDDTWNWALQVACGDIDMATDLLLFHLLKHARNHLHNKCEWLFRVPSHHWHGVYAQWLADVGSPTHLFGPHTHRAFRNLLGDVQEVLRSAFPQDKSLRGGMDALKHKKKMKDGRLLAPIAKILPRYQQLEYQYSRGVHQKGAIPDFGPIQDDVNKCPDTVAFYLLGESERRKQGISTPQLLQEFQGFMASIKASHGDLVAQYTDRINDGLTEAGSTPRHRAYVRRGATQESYVPADGIIIPLQTHIDQPNKHQIMSAYRVQIKGAYSKKRSLEEALDAEAQKWGGKNKPRTLQNMPLQSNYYLEDWWLS